MTLRLGGQHVPYLLLGLDALGAAMLSRIDAISKLEPRFISSAAYLCQVGFRPETAVETLDLAFPFEGVAPPDRHVAAPADAKFAGQPFPVTQGVARPFDRQIAQLDYRPASALWMPRGHVDFPDTPGRKFES